LVSFDSENTQELENHPAATGIATGRSARKELNMKMIKTIKTYLLFIIIFIFHRVPIQKNKIFFFCYYGSQYGCNPKYISQFILETEPKGKYEIVWAFNHLA